MARKPKIPPHVYDGLREQAVLGHIREPDMGKLVAHFFDVAGGEKAVAKMLYGEFMAAAEGSLVRQRIMDMIFRSTTRLNDKSNVGDDMENLTEEDIERELADTVESLEYGEEAPDEPAAADEPEAGEAPDAPRQGDE